MLKLKKRGAGWIDLGGKVRVKARPAGQLDVDLATSRARAKARQLIESGATLAEYGLAEVQASDVFKVDDFDLTLGASTLLVAVELGLATISVIDGVEDAEGQPAKVTRENLALFFAEWVTPGVSYASKFMTAVLAAALLEREEGNASAS